MNSNTSRAVAILVFIIGLVAAYLLGKGSGQREATAVLENKYSAGVPGTSGGGSSLSAIGANTETNPDGTTKSPSVKSIIGKARSKMQGGMMNISGMMRGLALLDAIGDDQIMEALAEVERSVTEPQQKMMFGMLLLARLAENDGPAAMAYADEHFSTKNPMMMGIKNGVVNSWAQSDPEAVWDWYQKQDDDDKGNRFGGRSMALVGIIGGLVQQDVDLAFERIASIEDEQERAMATQGLSQAIWDEGKRGEILAKIESIEDQSQRGQMRSGIVSQWAMMDSDGALEWAKNLRGEDRKATINQIGQSLAWADPERSGEVMLSIAESPEERENAYSTAIQSWARNDPNAAGEWLGKQEQGPELNRARQQFSMAIANKDPESAMAWAGAISDEQGRFDGIRNVHAQWQGKDKEAADAALESVDLSEERIKEIREANISVTPGAVHELNFQPPQ